MDNESASTFGRDLFPDNLVADAAATGKKHTRLPEELVTLVQRFRVRVWGRSPEGQQLAPEQLIQDIRATNILGDALALNPDVLEPDPSQPVEVDDEETFAQLQSSAHIQRLRRTGWQAGKTTESMLLELHQRGGYGFLFEYVSPTGLVSPVGYQFGFPSLPPRDQYPNLCADTIPNSDWYVKHPDKVMIIWRTGVPPAITPEMAQRLTSEAYIVVPPEIIGIPLQGLGIGNASKRVDAIAASVEQKLLVTCNIGRIVRIDHPTDILVTNEASEGSNGELFRRTMMTRSHADQVLSRGTETPIAKIFWEPWAATPAELLERTGRADGVIMNKGGMTLKHLDFAGKCLAYDLGARRVDVTPQQQ